MERELCGLQEGGGDEEEGDEADVGGGSASEGGGLGEELVKFEGAEALPDEEGGGEQAGFGEATDDEFFASGGDGLFAVGIEGEEFVESEACGDPG